MNKKQIEQWRITAEKLQELKLEVAKLEQLFKGQDEAKWEMIRNFVARRLREVTDNLNAL